MNRVALSIAGLLFLGASSAISGITVVQYWHFPDSYLKGRAKLCLDEKSIPFEDRLHTRGAAMPALNDKRFVIGIAVGGDSALSKEQQAEAFDCIGWFQGRSQ